MCNLKIHHVHQTTERYVLLHLDAEYRKLTVRASSFPCFGLASDRLLCVPFAMIRQT